jgi:hypothetical protein
MGAAGSDVAIHSAGIILMNDQLDRIPFVLKLSHRVVATIRQNLVFSTLFILVAVRAERRRLHPSGTGGGPAYIQFPVCRFQFRPIAARGGGSFMNERRTDSSNRGAIHSLAGLFGLHTIPGRPARLDHAAPVPT